MLNYVNCFTTLKNILEYLTEWSADNDALIDIKFHGEMMEIYKKKFIIETGDSFGDEAIFNFGNNLHSAPELNIRQDLTV